jgi:thioredoxin-like negative regulator of GroEL
MEKITSAQQFDQLIAHEGKVIVKFYTDWCPDCHRIDKGFAEYAAANQSRAVFAEINADQVQEVAERFDVRGIPSFLVFEKGELVDRLYSRDAKSVKQVTDFVDKVLALHA